VDASQRQLQLFADAVAHDLRAPLRSIRELLGPARTPCRGRSTTPTATTSAVSALPPSAMSGLLAQLSELSAVTRAN
jgi:light-regulated signal transduction histidine kinase (bacteriophytochrome)